MYCYNCGKELDDKAVVCPDCGVAQEREPEKDNKASKFLTGLLYFLLGFFMPSAGLVLYLVWSEERPSEAKAAISGVIVIFAILFIIGLCSLSTVGVHHMYVYPYN